MALSPRAASLAVALVLFALLQVLAWQAAGGYFEYPLDDVYIHLTIADSIARGEYGINPGEYASAASSVLYPVLFAPFSGTSLERFMPLVVNLIALIGIALTWARIVTLSGAVGRLSVVLAALGPLALNFAGAAFTGMEHALHVWASLLIVAGLIELVQSGRVGVVLMVAIILSPLLRFEGLALSFLACGAIALRGRVLPGLLLLGLTILPVAGFVAFLSAHDIGPLPTSVYAKQALAKGGDIGLLDRIIVNVIAGLNWPTAMVACAASIFLGFGALTLRRANPGLALIALAAAGTGIAHVVLGRFGWGYRYEAYVLATVGAVWVYAVMARAKGEGAQLIAVLAFMAVPAAVYLTKVPVDGSGSVRAIAFQQSQMARIAQEAHRGPVAVNDIGKVAWRNPFYVLDLYGLASREALHLRQDPNAPEGWAGPLAREHGVELAMIYGTVFPRAIPPDWQLVATLHAKGYMGWVVINDVDIYATGPEFAGKVTTELKAFVPDLPEGTELVFSP